MGNRHPCWLRRWFGVSGVSPSVSLATALRGREFNTDFSSSKTVSNWSSVLKRSLDRDAPMLHHMACSRGIEAPLDVALPQMFVNLVQIPGINNDLTKHAFNSDQIRTVIWVDVLHLASMCNETTNCANKGVSRQIPGYLEMRCPCHTSE